MKNKCDNNQPVSSENVEQLRKAFKRQLWKCIFFSIVAVCVIVFASIAWFVSNTRVNSSAAPISAGFEPIRLATRGVRQQAEVDHLQLKSDDEINKMEYDGKTYYYSEGDTIALRLNADNYEISPGSKGKVEFYVIPAGGASSVTLQIGVGGYGEDEKDNNKVKPINDNVLNALMSGHILLFDKYENGVYSDWLYQNNGSSIGIINNAITVDLSGKPAGVPVAVDFYWIWPLRYENMANDFTGVKGFVDFVERQAASMTDLENSGYRYSRIFFTNQESLTGTDERSKAYDLADEYIGSNAQYLYLIIQTSSSDDAEGGAQ